MHSTKKYFTVCLWAKFFWGVVWWGWGGDSLGTDDAFGKEGRGIMSLVHFLKGFSFEMSAVQREGQKNNEQKRQN